EASTSGEPAPRVELDVGSPDIDAAHRADLDARPDPQRQLVRAPAVARDDDVEIDVYLRAWSRVELGSARHPLRTRELEHPAVVTQGDRELGAEADARDLADAAHARQARADRPAPHLWRAGWQC